jgi:hypothetical protein
MASCRLRSNQWEFWDLSSVFIRLRRWSRRLRDRRLPLLGERGRGHLPFVASWQGHLSAQSSWKGEYKGC